MILSTVVPVQRKIRETVKSLVIIPGVISMVFMVVQVGTVFLCYSCCKELVNEICG